MNGFRWALTDAHALKVGVFSGHSSVVLAFTLVFLPLFVVQLMLLAKTAYQKAVDNVISGGRHRLQPTKPEIVAAYPGFYFPFC